MDRRKPEPGAAGAAGDAESGRGEEDAGAAVRALDTMLARGLMSREEHAARLAEIRAGARS